MATSKDTGNPAPTDQQALPHFVLADRESLPSEGGSFALVVQTERYRLASDSWLALDAGDGVVFVPDVPGGAVEGDGILGWYEDRPHELAFFGVGKDRSIYDPATGEPVSSDGIIVLGILFERRRLYKGLSYSAGEWAGACDARLATVAVFNASIAASKLLHEAELLSYGQEFSPMPDQSGASVAAC